MIGNVVIEKKEKIGQPKFLLAATYSLFSSAFFLVFPQMLNVCVRVCTTLQITPKRVVYN